MRKYLRVPKPILISICTNSLYFLLLLKLDDRKAETWEIVLKWLMNGLNYNPHSYILNSSNSLQGIHAQAPEKLKSSMILFILLGILKILSALWTTNLGLPKQTYIQLLTSFKKWNKSQKHRTITSKKLSYNAPTNKARKIYQTIEKLDSCLQHDVLKIGGYGY